VPQHREKHRHHTIDVDGVESTFMFTFAQVPRLLSMAAQPTRKCLIAHTISCYSRASVEPTFFKKSWWKGARIAHVFYKAVEKYATIYGIYFSLPNTMHSFRISKMTFLFILHSSEV